MLPLVLQQLGRHTANTAVVRITITILGKGKGAVARRSIAEACMGRIDSTNIAGEMEMVGWRRLLAVYREKGALWDQYICCYVSFLLSRARHITTAAPPCLDTCSENLVNHQKQSPLPRIVTIIGQSAAVP